MIVKMIGNEGYFMSNTKKTLAGSGVEMYLQGAFPKLKNNGEYGVNIVARKRRDVDPDAPYAGSYIRDAAYMVNGQERSTNNQLVTLEAFNKMREVNELEPLTNDDLQAAMPIYDDSGTKVRNGKSLVQRDAPVVFKTNVFTEEGHKSKSGTWSHMINPKVIEKSDKPDFSFAVERELEKLKKAERAQAKQQSGTTVENKAQSNELAR